MAPSMKKTIAVARTEVVKIRRRDIIQSLQVRQLNHLAPGKAYSFAFRERRHGRRAREAFFAWERNVVNVAT
jgi:hypothetical protein